MRKNLFYEYDILKDLCKPNIELMEKLGYEKEDYDKLWKKIYNEIIVLSMALEIMDIKDFKCIENFNYSHMFEYQLDGTDFEKILTYSQTAIINKAKFYLGIK